VLIELCGERGPTEESYNKKQRSIKFRTLHTEMLQHCFV
jgi:hypothetical protein